MLNRTALHLKGLTHPNDAAVDDWRELLEFFNIDCWCTMLDTLHAGADAAGVNLQAAPFIHFSGNFFWAKAQAIRDLGSIGTADNPEAWIGGLPTRLRLTSVHNSGRNHYHERYPTHLYQTSRRGVDTLTPSSQDDYRAPR
jgi:hypothetical protein